MLLDTLQAVLASAPLEFSTERRAPAIPQIMPLMEPLIGAAQPAQAERDATVAYAAGGSAAQQ